MFNWKTLAGGAAVSIMASAAIVQTADAQVTTSELRGTITSDSGTPLSGATVRITDPATGLTRSSTTSAAGNYAIRGLPVASGYSVSVDADAYQNQTIEGIGLSLGDVADIDFTLTTDDARTMDTIVVTASASDLIQTAVGPNATFGLEVLENAPTINRNITDVLRLDPRVYVDESRGDINPVQCAGKNPRFNSLTLDGVRLNDGFGLNANGYPTERQPFPYDAIQQVAIELAPFDVEYGGFTACNINAVTKSGTNEFHGVAFFDYTSDDLQGSSLEGDDIILADFDEKRYGIQIGGPIVQDKLFFSVTYEKLEGANTFDRGPIGSGAINEVNITQAELDEILDIARTIYQYDPGETINSLANEDEKLLFKLDWNINESHRAAFTYNYNDGFNTVESDGDIDEFEFSNHLYERGTELNQYVGQVFSDWTDNFSTEIRVGHVDVDPRVASLGGTDFGEITIETDDVDVYLGSDDSRQSNELDYTIFNMAFKGFYQFNDHSLTFGYEREETEIFNLFVQHTDTEIDFRATIDDNGTPNDDSDDFVSATAIENFRLGFAANIDYNNAPSGNPADAAAEFSYAVNTLYFQDEFALNPKLDVVLGLRYDFYTSDDKPGENPQFVADYGFSNSQNFDGEGVIQPRLAFTYDASDNVTFRGGIGRYSGGDPNVWLSNAFSGNNILQFGAGGGPLGLEDGSTSLFDLTYVNAEDGVPNTAGYAIPSGLDVAVATGTGSNFDLSYVDPDFELPSEWKFALGATWVPEFEATGFLGGEYVINADLLVSRGENSAIVLHGNLDQTGTDANGYPIFSSPRISSFVLTNAKDEANRSFTASLSVAKDYDNGLDWAVGYAYNDAEDVQPMTSSVAFSNYHNRAFFNPQAEELATSNYNIKHRFTALANYEHHFFGDYATGVSAFAVANSGRPYSFAMQNRGFFGFRPFVANASILAPGAERNSEEGAWWAKVDLRFEQELPGLRPDDRTSAFIVIDNFTNLLNDEWGILRQVDFPSLVEPGDPAESRIGDASRYEIRFGLRYEF